MTRKTDFAFALSNTIVRRGKTVVDDVIFNMGKQFGKVDFRCQQPKENMGAARGAVSDTELLQRVVVCGAAVFFQAPRVFIIARALVVRCNCCADALFSPPRGYCDFVVIALHSAFSGIVGNHDM